MIVANLAVATSETVNEFYSGRGVQNQAAEVYESVCRRPWRERLSSALHHDSFLLDALSQAQARSSDRGSYYAGTQTVPINRIRGSENRSRDFDEHFHPLQSHTAARWIGIAEARLRGVPLPPVELIQVGADYYVRDGHHRISVARALGEEFIDAIVVARRPAPINPVCTLGAETQFSHENCARGLRRI
jgi:hypothetical protein